MTSVGATHVYNVEGGMSQWPRSLTTRTVLALIDPAVESVGESRVAYLCHAQGLPRPQTQVRVRDRAGRVVARVDFAWPEHKVNLEVDHPFWHAGAEESRRDKNRDLLLGTVSWYTGRLTDLDVHGTLAASIAHVGQILALRS